MSATVLAVTGKMKHFGSYSGYNRLYQYLNQNMPVIVHQNNMKQWELRLARKFALRNVWSSKYGLYHNTAHLFTEYEAFKTALKIKPEYLHVAFLEDTLGFLADSRSRLPSKLFATSHQPPEWWQMTKKNTEILKALDGMIVLSKNAQRFFDAYIPGKVTFIPHGVDTNFFIYKPRAKNSSIKRILFVGNWLRDLETFVKTIEALEERSAGNFAYDIVYPNTIEIPSNPLHRLLKYNNVNWYKRISDDDLKNLYHKAAVLFIPFINATANNAVLEAAACGTPILTNKLESITDNFGNANNIYAVDSKTDTFISYLLHITSEENFDEVACKTMQLRKYTEQQLDWSVIAKQHQTFFESTSTRR